MKTVCKKFDFNNDLVIKKLDKHIAYMKKLDTLTKDHKARITTLEKAIQPQ